MKYHSTEGITLHAIPYKERDRIITVFTREYGIISCIAKRTNSIKNPLYPLTHPLTRGEFIYTQGRNSLATLHDGSLITSNITLRASLPVLEVAMRLVSIINQSQYPGKPAPNLYHLLILFLRKLPQSTYPQTILASFIMKLLKHEGSLAHTLSCASCRQPLTEGTHSQGEWFCKNHSLPHAITFSQDDLSLIALLASSRSLNTIATTPIPKELLEKITSLLLS